MFEFVFLRNEGWLMTIKWDHIKPHWLNRFKSKPQLEMLTLANYRWEAMKTASVSFFDAELFSEWTYLFRNWYHRTPLLNIQLWWELFYGLSCLNLSCSAITFVQSLPNTYFLLCVLNWSTRLSRHFVASQIEHHSPIAVATPHTLMSGFKHVNGESCRLRFFASMFLSHGFQPFRCTHKSKLSNSMAFTCQMTLLFVHIHFCTFPPSHITDFYTYSPRRALNSEMNFHEIEQNIKKAFFILHGINL